MSEPHEHGASERVTADELAYYMAGALTESEEEKLERRIEKDPAAPELLDRLRNIDGVFRAAYPPSAPEPRPSETMPLQRAARVNADLAGEALRRFDPDHLRSTPYGANPDRPGPEDDERRSEPGPDRWETNVVRETRHRTPSSPLAGSEWVDDEGDDEAPSTPESR